MTLPRIWAGLAALRKRFARWHAGGKVPVKVIDRQGFLNYLARLAQSRRAGS